MLEISRLTFLIRGKRENENELYAKLGRSIYQRWTQTGEVELTDRTRAVLLNIKAVREKIEELEEQLTELKKEVATSPVETSQDPSRPNGTNHPALPPGHTLVDARQKQPAEKDEASWDAWEGRAIFLCPRCQEQVREETSACPHCRQPIYG
ncbi:hypothetical protein ACFOUO_08820 [Salinithrix halophila]|uniref:Zinc ribbon domain-containing protein n=2 Tax=Salinithrix halophila TaxID=1485204 RepID=A0ABV8JI49_9BACL